MTRGLAVLIYHRIGLEPDPLRPRTPTAAQFRAQLRALSRWFRPTGLGEGLRRLRDGTLPARSVAITFDDGYADNARVALPILLREGIPACFFVATAYLDGGRMWNDTVIEAVRRMPPGRHPFPHAGIGAIEVPEDAARSSLSRALLDSLKHLPQNDRQQAADRLQELAGGPLPSDLMMRSEDVRALLDAGMEVGGHTRTHPILASLSDSRAEEEIRGGLDDLARITGRRTTLFAYPNGRRGQDYGEREIAILRRAGIEAALVTHPGVVRADTDPLQMPRLRTVHRNPLRFAITLWRAYHSASEAAPGPSRAADAYDHA